MQITIDPQIAALLILTGLSLVCAVIAPLTWRERDERRSGGGRNP